MIEFEKASRYIKMLHELYNVRSLIIDEMGEDANETFLVNELIKNIHLHLNGIEIYKPISEFELALQNRSNEASGPSEDSETGFAAAAFSQGLQFDLGDNNTASPETEEIRETTKSEEKEDENSFRSAIDNLNEPEEDEAEEEPQSLAEAEAEDAYDWDVEEEEEDQNDHEIDFGDEFEEEEEKDSEEDHEFDEEEVGEEMEVEIAEEPEAEEIQEEAPKPKLKGIRILSRKPQPDPESESTAPDPIEEKEEISEPEPEPEPYTEPEPEPEPEIEPAPDPEPQRNLFSFDDVSTESAEPEEQVINADARFNAEYDDLFDQGNANEISDRLSSAVVSDLRKAFGLNERIYYTNELFNKNKPAFESALDDLNGLDDFEYAREYIEKKLIEEFNWSEPRRRSKAKTFIRTVRRKFD